jgi:2-polyprenyl-3-methyl-5-hydroxy-6-metoxy-1,4-benzoquinol methylase/uncharacterized protein YbaR (Trm112 family)
MVQTKTFNLEKAWQTSESNQWYLEVVGCPQCKAHLEHGYDCLFCNTCGISYPIESGIPVLLSPLLKLALKAELEPVKSFYLEERYDWTKDPRGLEFLYHRYRRWVTWKHIEKLLKPASIVLDIGCGTGLITRNFARKQQKAIALDLNRWALSRMGNLPFITQIQCDVEVLPIKDESVDLVVATEMVEHLEQPEKTASEIFRVCKKGGKVVGTVPSTSDIWKMRRHLSLSCAGNEPFHRNYTKQEITDLLSSAGFKVKVKSICFGLNWLWILEKP